MRSAARACCAAVVLLLLPSAAQAAVIVPIQFRELVVTAPVIVRGRVTALRSDWVDGRRAVETFVTISATEYLKGSLGPEITIAVPGGRLGRYRTIFIGAPVFQPGDDVVLFLENRSGPYPFVIGLNQGVFRLAAVTGEPQRIIDRPIVMGGRDRQAERLVRGDAARRGMTWERFRDLVRRALAEGSGR